jgi:hypothetical protein
MRYTIKEILPGQIKVEFEDGSWAMVPVHQDAKPDEIDNVVAKYDPDFLPDPESITNKNISVGEERTSVQSFTDTNVNSGISSDLVYNSSEDENSQKNGVDFGLVNGIDVLAISNYYAEQGDTRIKDALTSKIQKFISNSDFSFDEFVERLEYDTFDADDIFSQAEAELNGQ